MFRINGRSLKLGVGGEGYDMIAVNATWLREQSNWEDGNSRLQDLNV